QGGIRGQVTDIEISARELLHTKQRLNELLAKHTGQTIERITQDTERDKWLSGEEAKEYGLIDEVVHPKERKK
ncbi:MAG TPA: ATP-dependent Clp protease proteolytic subunit, partial [Symbiobacteriaceae bacterium]|nr:ATP-dependent Clp protease proteolytic subunit [Symbiobacteriaceae bacterium]